MPRPAVDLLLLLPAFAVCISACAVKPGYAPVPDGVMRKLGKQVKSAQELGVVHRGSGISYDAKVDGPPVATVALAVNSVIPTLRCWLNDSKDPTPLMFDSGAQISLIDADTAISNNIGIVDPRKTNITVMGVMGKERMLAGIFSPIRFGDTRLTKQLCLVRTHRNETRWGAMRREKVSMDLLGFDLVRQWCRYITIDYPAHRMHFGFKEDFKPPAATGPNVWKVPLIIEGGMPHIVLESRGIRWLSLVDTGSAFGVEIDEGLAAELDVLRNAKPVSPGMINTAIGGMADVNQAGIKLATLKKLEGLGPVHTNAEIAISPGGARVGSFAFKDYRVTLDLNRETFWIER